MAEKLADQPENIAEKLAETVADEPRAEFMFTDEQQELLAAVRRFCAENFDEQTVRRLMESDPPFDAKTWQRLGTELGVLGLSVPEADGGVGGTLVDQAVAVEELGAALACGPFFGTVYLAIPALVAASSSPVRDEVLAELVEGRRTAAFAVRDRAGDLDTTVTVTATPAGEDWALSGTVEWVVDAGAADDLLVAAAGPNGLGLFVVDAAAAGVERTPLRTVDLTRPQATISLSDAPARLVAGPDEAARVISHALHVGAALLATEQVGAAQHILDVAVQYAKDRLQFGRPIGSFQAVKHRLADMMVDLEHARSTAYHAVWALSEGSDDPALAASIAQATCSAAFSRIAADAIQTLGGIGFTWEHQAHLYFKRATVDAALLGSAEEHRSRVAAMVLDTASPEKMPRIDDGTA
ncbi:acyl-CoA dehydrogenase [Mycolicibacterium madagascariense]|uniref:Acyl-CoA dehydrogenase n=1 Tax=Mycolicibacterium madagascariense TaxID=212765 RepID=A0A7I7X9B5_9MYCO|nr:acyl-CoA dehydrogenase family protein [Mycolicibacterium madagascariense]BBZ26154.1 acyl-CoA dehydrogenase [Mycolicibacterium madagascariense]